MLKSKFHDNQPTADLVVGGGMSVFGIRGFPGTVSTIRQASIILPFGGRRRKRHLRDALAFSTARAAAYQAAGRIPLGAGE